jgi:gas vesicle protein
MGAIKRWFAFGVGGVVGFVSGVVGAIFTAPGSGADTRRRLDAEIARVKLAGVEAQAAAKQGLIERYRQEVGDPTALQGEAERVRIERAEAVRAIGLGLNAPGALAAHTLLNPEPPDSESAGRS